MLTLLTHLCWRWALAGVVLPLRVESSSSLVFKGECSWPGLHCVGSFSGIQLMKFGLFLSHSCSSFMIWLLLKCVGISEITMSVCFLFWNLRSESETRKVVTKKCIQVYFQFTSTLSCCSCWGWAVWFRAGEAPALQFRFDGRGLSCWSFWKCLSFVYVKKFCASSLPLLPPSFPEWSHLGTGSVLFGGLWIFPNFRKWRSITWRIPSFSPPLPFLMQLMALDCTGWGDVVAHHSFQITPKLPVLMLLCLRKHQESNPALSLVVRKLLEKFPPDASFKSCSLLSLLLL